MPTGVPGSKVRRVIRRSSPELRQFRLDRMQNPDRDASHLRGACKFAHPTTLENTVRLGNTGYFCRLCRRKTSLESKHRIEAGKRAKDP